MSRHQSGQEARSRQELDGHRAQRLEQMRADVEDRERRLGVLREQLDRGSKMSRLHRQRSAKELRQVCGWTPVCVCVCGGLMEKLNLTVR